MAEITAEGFIPHAGKVNNAAEPAGRASFRDA
jgi:hypothetical protein